MLTEEQTAQNVVANYRKIINKLIQEAPQRHAERVARWKTDPQVNDMMRSTAL